jgi:hypothetical protein
MYAWFYSHQPLIAGAVIGLSLFFTVFVAIVVRQLTPAARRRADDDARLPFDRSGTLEGFQTSPLRGRQSLPTPRSEGGAS